MTETADKRFVDHPAPSIGLMTILIAAAVAFVMAISIVLQNPPGQLPPWSVPLIVGVLILFLAILGLSFWFLYTTYYTVDKLGLTVKYGPSTHTYRWEEFETAYWRKGMFATKIGLPSVTPCVRLSNAVALHRKDKFWPLYLTPNDPKAFIAKIALFAPELTGEMIL